MSAFCSALAFFVGLASAGSALAQSSTYLCSASDDLRLRNTLSASCAELHPLGNSSSFLVLLPNSSLAPIMPENCRALRPCNSVPDPWLTLVKTSPRCDRQISQVSDALVQQLTSEFALICTGSASMRALDEQLWQCRKQGVHFPLPNCPPFKETRPLALGNLTAGDDPRKQAFIAEVTEAGEEGRFLALLSALSGVTPVILGAKGSVSLHTRYTFTAENSLAAEYLSQWFSEHGAHSPTPSPLLLSRHSWRLSA